MFLAHRRILELETAQKQLQHDFLALSSAWDSERVHLADLKEQAIRTINRLQQQKRRAEPNGEPLEPPKPMNPLAQQLLKGTQHELLPR